MTTYSRFMSIAFVSGVSGINLTNERGLRRAGSCDLNVTNERGLRRAGTTVPSSEARLIQGTQETEKELKRLSDEKNALWNYILRMMQAQRVLAKAQKHYDEVSNKITEALPTTEKLLLENLDPNSDITELLKEIKKDTQDIKKINTNVVAIKKDTVWLKNWARTQFTKDSFFQKLFAIVTYFLIFLIVGQLWEMFVGEAEGYVFGGELAGLNSLNALQWAVLSLVIFWIFGCCWKVCCINPLFSCNYCGQEKGFVELCCGNNWCARQLTCGSLNPLRHG